MQSLSIYDPTQSSLAPAFTGDINPIIDCPFDEIPQIVRWQLEQLKQPPREFRHHDANNFDYLDIAYIQDEADRIFGSGNWGVVPQGQIEVIDGTTSKGDPKQTLIDRIVVWVRFANGKTQALDALGIGEFYPANARANFAASAGIARSEAIKSAFKRLGSAFGRNLKEQIADGLAEEIKANNAADAIDRVLEQGDRWFSSKNSPDRILDVEALEYLAQFYGKTTYSEAAPKTKLAIYNAIMEFPTIRQKSEIVEVLSNAGEEVDEGTPIAKIRELCRKHKMRW